MRRCLSSALLCLGSCLVVLALLSADPGWETRPWASLSARLGALVDAGALRLRRLASPAVPVGTADPATVAARTAQAPPDVFESPAPTAEGEDTGYPLNPGDLIRVAALDGRGNRVEAPDLTWSIGDGAPQAMAPEVWVQVLAPGSLVLSATDGAGTGARAGAHAESRVVRLEILAAEPPAASAPEESAASGTAGGEGPSGDGGATPDGEPPTGPDGSDGRPLWTIPVALVAYVDAPGDPQVAASLTDLGKRAAAVLTDGTRWRGFENPGARPSVEWTVADTILLQGPAPRHGGTERRFSLSLDRPAPPSGVHDYQRVATQARIGRLAAVEGVAEIWLFTDEAPTTELLMATPPGLAGDVWRQGASFERPYEGILNPDHDRHPEIFSGLALTYFPDEMPRLQRPYTLIHLSRGSGVEAVVGAHLDLLEALLNHADRRHETPRHRWGDLLFWGRFCGADRTYRSVDGRCGWSRRPPTASSAGDYGGDREVLSDLPEWSPAGGRRVPVTSALWGGTRLGWYLRWMQTLPGDGASLYHEGHALRNWWSVLGDQARTWRRGHGLTY